MKIFGFKRGSRSRPKDLAGVRALQSGPADFVIASAEGPNTPFQGLDQQEALDAVQSLTVKSLGRLSDG
jgi:hypothetical protein